MNSINFDNVWLLFIAIPIIALVSVPFAIAVRSDNRNGHNIASLVLHILMAVIIAFAAAGTSVVTVITKTQVYVVADVSYSARKNLDTIDGYIKDLQNNLPRNSEMGLICFAKTPVTVTGLGGELESVRTALDESNPNRLDDSETNIVEALEYAGKQFSGDVIKRVVLVTDGRQSDMRDDNSLKRAADELAAQGVKLDAIYVNDNLDLYGEGVGVQAKELQISNATYTKNAFLNGEDNKVTAYVFSSYEVSNIPVKLYRDGEPFKTEYVNLSKGSNSVSFELPSNEVNSYDYQIKLEGLNADDDECLFNNTYSFTQRVTGAVSVMLLTEDTANETYLSGLYGEECDLTTFVVGRDDTKIPLTAEGLAKYDEIVLADVNISKLPSANMFVDALKKVVNDLGKHLITIGDLGIQTAQDEALFELDGMLPVRYGHNDNDPKLLALVIDTSRSMENNYRLIMAKQAAKQLVGFLNPQDQVLIVEFNGSARLALNPTDAGKIQTVSDVIDNLGPMQSTEIYKGLKMAYDEIAPLASRYKERQVMLITDGLSYNSATGAKEIDQITTDMAVNNVKLSVIDVGRGGGGSDTDSTATTLKGYAAKCKGDYFYTISPEDLDKIIYTEIKDSQSDLVIKDRASIIRNRRQDEVYEGCEPETKDEYVTGFVNSSAKGGAITVYKAEYYRQEVEGYATAPLYAYWKYGSNGGVVSTYTSSIIKSASDNWNNKERFLKNVVKSNVPEEKNSVPYSVETVVRGAFARIQLTPLNFYPDGRAVAEVSYDGKTETVEFKSNTAGFYADVNVSKLGKYSVKVDYYCNGSEAPYTENVVVNVDYKSEYDAFANYDASDLYKMVGEGQVSENGKLVLVNDDRDVATYVYPLVPVLLGVCAALFVADIMVRKLKWADIKNLFVKIDKNNKMGK